MALRTVMTATLGPLPRVAVPGQRRPTAGDALALAALYTAAYSGTVDDEGETPDQALAEVQRTWDGAYGPFLLGCSNVVLREGVLVAATLLTHWRERPLVAYALTHPQWQRQGLARAGMVNAMQDLWDAGERQVSLAVTLANTPALRLYQQLGFVPGR